MKKDDLTIINSISELHNFLKIKNPSHPLVSVVNLSDIPQNEIDEAKNIIYNFFSIYLKKNFDGKIKYGHQYYDFDNGLMTFFAPKQLFTVETNSSLKVEGWMLIFHPDFLQSYQLAKTIKEYGFFSYATNEALHLSNSEEIIISDLLLNLQREIKTGIDHFTQDLIISHIDLLLNYCNRFYNRQFITRKKASSDLFLKFEQLLDSYFQKDDFNELGSPTVQYFAEKLNISSHYLNDMLKNLTGSTTQQHIQNKMIVLAQELLTTTNLSVSEIAYKLGFEFPQSFNKLFKKATNLTPLAYRQKFN